MQNTNSSCCDSNQDHGNYGLVIVVVLYILLAIILSSFVTC